MCGDGGNTCDRVNGSCICNDCYSGYQCETGTLNNSTAASGGIGGKKAQSLKFVVSLSEESSYECFVQFLGIADKVRHQIFFLIITRCLNLVFDVCVRMYRVKIICKASTAHRPTRSLPQAFCIGLYTRASWRQPGPSWFLQTRSSSTPFPEIQ